MFEPCAVARYFLMIASKAVWGVEYATSDNVTVGLLFDELELEPLFELLLHAANTVANANTPAKAPAARGLPKDLKTNPPRLFSTNLVGKLDYPGAAVNSARERARCASQ
jgi:hypothetical protein